MIGHEEFRGKGKCPRTHTELEEENTKLRKALEPFAKKECIRSATVVLMKKEVVEARKALGWKNPLAHWGRDD